MNQPPVNISPRPSSHGSSHSNQSGSNVSTKAWSRGKNDICVGEELKIAVDIAMERFRLSEEQKGLCNNRCVWGQICFIYSDCGEPMTLYFLLYSESIELVFVWSGILYLIFLGHL